MRIILDGQSVELKTGSSYLDAVRTLYPGDHRRVLGVRVQGRSLSLNDPAEEGLEAFSLTARTEEGRRIYERSIRFLLLMAMRRLYPEVSVRVENSTRLGLLVTLRGMTVDAGVAARIEKQMKELVQADLPYKESRLTRSEAIDCFRRLGKRDDKVRLLGYQPRETFRLYTVDGVREYFYGVMAPSTAYTPVFAVHAREEGLELALPDPADPTKTADFFESPLLMKTFAESRNWARILGCENLADLNELIERNELNDLIQVNEALHEKSVSEIADAFTRSGAQLILIAGPSSSGKTTFANRLSIQLRVRGLIPLKLSMDDYYRNRDELPREADGKHDLERVDALDVPRLGNDLAALLRGEPVDGPVFDFVAQRRSERVHRMQLKPGQPIIMEGIHALNDRITEDVPRERKFQIYVSALTTMNMDDHNRIRTTDVRLLRRIVRDNMFRGTSPEGTMAMWDSVRRGEDNYIFPFQENADVMFNSTLVYELAVLKKYAYPMLSQITGENPYYTRANRIIKFLEYVYAVDAEDEIPPNSLLREFIGGCCFYREKN
jgi:uridine kinase